MSFSLRGHTRFLSVKLLLLLFLSSPFAPQASLEAAPGLVQKCINLTKKVASRVMGSKGETGEASSNRPAPVDYEARYLEGELAILRDEIAAERPFGIRYAQNRSKWESQLGVEFVQDLEKSLLLSLQQEAFVGEQRHAAVVNLPHAGDSAKYLLRNSDVISMLIENLDSDRLSPQQFTARAAAVFSVRRDVDGNYDRSYEDFRAHQDYRLKRAGFSEAEINQLRELSLIRGEEDFRNARAEHLEDRQISRVKRSLRQEGRAQERDRLEEGLEEARRLEREERERARRVEDKVVEVFGENQVRELSALLSGFVRLGDGAMIHDQDSYAALVGGDRLLFQWFSPRGSVQLLQAYTRLSESHPNDPSRRDREMQSFIANYLQSKHGVNRRTPYPHRSAPRSISGNIFLEVQPPTDET